MLFTISLSCFFEAIEWQPITLIQSWGFVKTYPRKYGKYNGNASGGDTRIFQVNKVSDMAVATLAACVVGPSAVEVLNSWDKCFFPIENNV